ncbi:MAG TPA: hypothetical protein VEM76_00220 [Anaeromyxobacteraceae bacterium]|nr:hypothetical protein [Anaeromyxobacteraceae bacterium]
MSEACFVMQAIDSSAAEVSSSAAACSLAPWATDWLVEAICPEAEVTCSAPVATCSIASCSAPAVALSDSLMRACWPR